MNRHAYISAQILPSHLNQEGDRGMVRALVAHIGTRNGNGNLYLKGSIGKQTVMISRWNHSAIMDSEPPVAWGSLEESGADVNLSVDYDLTDPRQAEAYRVIQAGGENLEWSIGLVPNRSEYRIILDDNAEPDEYFTMEYAKAVSNETSPVSAGADPDTRTISINAYPQSILDEVASAVARRNAPAPAPAPAGPTPFQINVDGLMAQVSRRRRAGSPSLWIDGRRYEVPKEVRRAGSAA